MKPGVRLVSMAVEPRSAFDPFFMAHFDQVARASAFVTRDPVTGQDLAQEAFTRLLERWDDMDSDDHARNFVFKVAINLSRSHLRKFARVRPYGLRPPDGLGTSDPSGRTTDWAEVAEALGALSPRQRACVILVDYADMDPAGAAGVLGMSAGTVRVHLMRGRRALRTGLGMNPREDES